MSDEQLLAHAVDALAQPGELAPELTGALSHLLTTDLNAVSSAWATLPVERRLEILAQLAHSERQNHRLDFNAIYGIFNADLDESVVESHMSKLRKKLRTRLGYDLIQSKRYVGYKLIEAGAPAAMQLIDWPASQASSEPSLLYRASTWLPTWAHSMVRSALAGSWKSTTASWPPGALAQVIC